MFNRLDRIFDRSDDSKHVDNCYDHTETFVLTVSLSGQRVSLTKHTIDITSFLSVEKLCFGVTNIFHWIKNHHFQKPQENFLHMEMRNGWSMKICSSVQLVQSIFLFQMTRMWMEWLIFFANRLFFFSFSIEMWTLQWRWSYCWLLRAAVSNELSLHVRKGRWCTVPRWQEGILCSAFFQSKQGG